MAKIEEMTDADAAREAKTPNAKATEGTKTRDDDDDDDDDGGDGGEAGLDDGAEADAADDLAEDVHLADFVDGGEAHGDRL